MPSLYLQAADYCLYGLPGTTTPEEVVRASTLINAFCHRPEGFISTDGATMDATGEPVVQEQDVRSRARIVLSRTPVVTLIKLEGAPFGQPFFWREYTLTDSGYLAKHSGVLDLPPGFPAPGRVRVTYVAGWTYESLPDPIKLAAATLIKRISASDDLGPDVKKASAGDASIEFFQRRYLDAEVAGLLADYVRQVPG